MAGKRGSLAQRLALVKQGSGNKLGFRQNKLKAESGKIPPGEGWQALAPMVWERHLHYPSILPEYFHQPFVLPEAMESEHLWFYDLETTGLSGGAGNTAFLIGLGHQEKGNFKVIQLFLADYPGEPDLLRRYAQVINQKAYQVSFNGRSFDFHVLKNRFLMSRMPPLNPPQIDLLYPSRRLWGSLLPNVSLGTLEKEVLGFYRQDDIPGSEAPQAWFQWLSDGSGPIEGVMQHNADDVVSLARLLKRLEHWGSWNPLGQTDAPPGQRPSAGGMARQASESRLSLLWLQAGWQRGETSCGRELAAICKREGRWEEACRYWEEIKRFSDDYQAAVELAKYWEHRKKSPETALKFLSGLERLPLSVRQLGELSYRRRRLERKAQFQK